MKVTDIGCLVGKKGGLKKAISTSFLPSNFNKDNLDFVIVESPPSTYIFQYTKHLYNDICSRLKDPYDEKGDFMLSALDYRFIAPMFFVLNSFNSNKIEIYIKKLVLFPEFLHEYTPKKHLMGTFKVIFGRYKNNYKLSDIKESNKIIHLT